MDKAEIQPAFPDSNVGYALPNQWPCTSTQPCSVWSDIHINKYTAGQAYDFSFRAWFLDGETQVNLREWNYHIDILPAGGTSTPASTSTFLPTVTTWTCTTVPTVAVVTRTITPTCTATNTSVAKTATSTLVSTSTIPNPTSTIVINTPANTDTPATTSTSIATNTFTKTFTPTRTFTPTKTFTPTNTFTNTIPQPTATEIWIKFCYGTNEFCVVNHDLPIGRPENQCPTPFASPDIVTTGGCTVMIESNCGTLEVKYSTWSNFSFYQKTQIGEYYSYQYDYYPSFTGNYCNKVKCNGIYMTKFYINATVN